MYVILCAYVWFTYSTSISAIAAYNTHPKFIQEAGCSKVTEVDKTQLDYYHSEEYTPMWSEVMPNEELLQKKAELPPVSSHCSYDIVPTAPHIWKLVSICN